MNKTEKIWLRVTEKQKKELVKRAKRGLNGKKDLTISAYILIATLGTEEEK